MSDIIPFKFDVHHIRVVTDEHGEPLFVGKDLCEALGYANHSDAMAKHCRGVAKRYPIVDSLGRTQETRVLTEGDMFRLIVGSTLPSAERFERWVFDEVLPSIRKTGGYQVLAAPALPNFADPVAAARAWADAKEGEQKALELAQQQATELEAAAPAVEFVNRYVDANGSKGFREVCKLLRANEREFGDWLTKRGIMYRLGGKLTPRQHHIDAGRFEVKAGVSTVNDHAYNQSRFTTKGVTWIAGEWGKRLLENALEPRRYGDEPANTSIARREAV